VAHIRLPFSVYAIDKSTPRLLALCADAATALREVARRDSHVVMARRPKGNAVLWHEGAEICSAADLDRALVIVRHRLRFVAPHVSGD